MTYDWLVATPAWGERCLGSFVNTALPAIKAAAARSRGTVRFVVHTDDPKQIKQALAQAFPPLERHQVLPLPRGDMTNRYVTLGNTHRESTAHLRQGECIAFINADMVPSVEVFEAAEKRFAEGKRLIMMAAPRTTLGSAAPIGARSVDLLRWAMNNQHELITEVFWGSGRSHVPATVYFRQGDNIVLHGFNLHPFAAMNDRPLIFTRKTIDIDLPDRFKQHEIHVVTDADEAAFAEVSPPVHKLKLGAGVISVWSIAAWAKTQLPMHHWFFGHRITICGDGRDIGDGRVCDEILRAL